MRIIHVTINSINSNAIYDSLLSTNFLPFPPPPHNPISFSTLEANSERFYENTRKKDGGGSRWRGEERDDGTSKRGEEVEVGPSPSLTQVLCSFRPGRLPLFPRLSTDHRHHHHHLLRLLLLLRPTVDLVLSWFTVTHKGKQLWTRRESWLWRETARGEVKREEGFSTFFFFFLPLCRRHNRWKLIINIFKIVFCIFQKLRSCFQLLWENGCCVKYCLC